MERAFLWFKCAAVHDPVRPVLKRPAAIGWEAKYREIDLVIERPLRGEDLLSRMKGWFTVNVQEVIGIVKEYGKLKLLDDCHLVVETESEAEMAALQEKLGEVFGPEVGIEPFVKKKLA